jgi:hypothetical protein
MVRRVFAGLCLAGLAASAQAQSISAQGQAISVQVSGRNSITWQLEDASEYRFARDSIDFGDAANVFSCTLLDAGQALRCTRTDGAAVAGVKYRVKLEPTGNGATRSIGAPSNYFWIQNN